MVCGQQPAPSYPVVTFRKDSFSGGGRGLAVTGFSLSGATQLDVKSCDPKNLSKEENCKEAAFKISLVLYIFTLYEGKQVKQRCQRGGEVPYVVCHHPV